MQLLHTHLPCHVIHPIDAIRCNITIAESKLGQHRVERRIPLDLPKSLAKTFVCLPIRLKATYSDQW